MKSLSSDVTFYHYKVTLHLYKVELHRILLLCVSWLFSCYLDIWDSYRRGYVGLLVHHLPLLLIETLTHCRSVVRLSLFYRCYFEICPSKMAELVPLLYSRGSSCRYSNRMYDFSVIPRCYKDISVNRTFSHTVKLWNYLPAKHFPLVYDLSGFMSAINRHLFGLYLKQFS